MITLIRSIALPFHGFIVLHFGHAHALQLPRFD
jgi:hypothetical protein